ncbi:hypothetical protein BGX21_010647 [Mortierella sp. AD011]|nr:hypothetical protein BGX21_010647 [Mortierella sp. AD011]
MACVKRIVISHGNFPLGLTTTAVVAVEQLEQGLQDTVWLAASRSSCKDVTDIAAAIVLQLLHPCLAYLYTQPYASRATHPLAFHDNFTTNKSQTVASIMLATKRIKINNEDLHDNDAAITEGQQSATQFARWIQDSLVFITTEPARQELPTTDVAGSSAGNQVDGDEGDH